MINLVLGCLIGGNLAFGEGDCGEETCLADVNDSLGLFSLFTRASPLVSFEVEFTELNAIVELFDRFEFDLCLATMSGLAEGSILLVGNVVGFVIRFVVDVEPGAEEADDGLLTTGEFDTFDTFGFSSSNSLALLTELL